MNLDELKIIIASDSVKLTTENVSERLSIQPVLYGKYLNFLIDEKTTYNIMNSDSKRLFLELKEYYRGLSDVTSIVGDRPPFNKKILEKEIPTYIEADEKYCDIHNALLRQKLKLESIEKMIEWLKFHPNTIKTLVTWEMFKAGA